MTIGRLKVNERACLYDESGNSMPQWDAKEVPYDSLLCGVLCLGQMDADRVVLRILLPGVSEIHR